MPNTLLKAAAMGVTTSGLGSMQHNSVFFGYCVPKEFPLVTARPAVNKFIIVISLVWALADFSAHCYSM